MQILYKIFIINLKKNAFFRIGTIFSFGYVSLNISDLRADDSGTYSCRATNKVIKIVILTFLSTLIDVIRGVERKSWGLGRGMYVETCVFGEILPKIKKNK